MASFFDTHTHLDYPDYKADLPEVISRAEKAGIIRLIAIGTDLESSRQAITLAEQYAPIFAVVGVHPGNALEAPEDIRAELRSLTRHPKVVAVGETGLDYYRLPSATGGSAEEDERVKIKQAALFRQQLEVAGDAGLNCVIHERSAFADVAAIFRPYTPRIRGVFHCFVNDSNAMRQVLEMNSLVSFTGIVTFKNAPVVRETVAATPMGKFMLETDCPYLAPVPYRGKRCEPAYVKEISETVAAVKGCSLEELSAATCGAAREFFPRLA